MIAYEVFEEYADGATVHVGQFPTETEAQEFAAGHYETRIGRATVCGCEVCDEYAPVIDWQAFAVRVAGWGK